MNTKTKSVNRTFSVTSNHLRHLRPWEIWSNVFKPDKTPAAKFCTNCSLCRLRLDVFPHTKKQKKVYRKQIKLFISNKRVFLSKRCLILPICTNWFMTDQHPGRKRFTSTHGLYVVDIASRFKGAEPLTLKDSLEVSNAF